MLDKLNKAASLIADLIAGQPEPKKRKKSEDDLPDDELAEGEEDATKRAQKSIRKNMGGMKEPL